MKTMKIKIPNVESDILNNKLSYNAKSTLQYYKKYLEQNSGSCVVINMLELLLSDINKDSEFKIELKKLLDSKDNTFNSKSNDIDYFIGVCYQFGLGLDKDLKRAAELYQIVATHGYPPAINSLGFCYEYGMGVPCNLSKAVKLYQNAADKQYAVAEYYVALCFHCELEGIEKNPRMAFSYFEKAAAKGLSSAEHYLAYYYQHGMGCERNKDRAFELYSLASQKGYPPSKCELAVFFKPSFGFNEIGNYHLYFDATTQGYVPAYAHLASFFERGSIVIKDKKQGYFLVQLAAEQNDPWAQFMLGQHYIFGDVDSGFPIDHARAALLLQASKKQGNMFAIEVFRRFKDYPSIELAYQHYLDQLEKGNNHALTTLGFCCQFGIGTSQDIKKAKEYYQLAKEKGLGYGWDFQEKLDEFTFVISDNWISSIQSIETPKQEAENTSLENQKNTTISQPVQPSEKSTLYAPMLHSKLDSKASQTLLLEHKKNNRRDQKW